MRGNTRYKNLRDYNVLIFNPANIYYYTGFSGSGFFSVIDGKPKLYVPEMEYETAKKTSLVPVRILDWKKIKLPKTIYVEFSYVSLALKKRLKGHILKDIDDVVFRQRAVKDDNEIGKMRKIGKFTNMMFLDIVKNIRLFKTEKDIEYYIKKWAVEHEVDLSFDPIVANNASEIHYVPKRKLLRRGFLLIDAGLKDEYCSDMTRTFFLGRPNEYERKLYNKVLDSYNETLSSVKEGMKFSELDEISKRNIKYPHLVGHSVGLEVHERIDVIRKGSIFTIEPGLYGKKNGKSYGIRIEDTILFSSFCEVLTPFDRNMMTL